MLAGPSEGPEVTAVEDVVAEDEGDRVVADEVGADDEAPARPSGRLHGIRDLDPPARTVAEETLELLLIRRGRDDRDLLMSAIIRTGEG